ncbi:M3 family oligoendopeptidase [Clostridiales bacterium COT073_COT-073]|nr:M3 family oligoendopeptidase [Clostridiales bacterium COT073_COT-073]
MISFSEIPYQRINIQKFQRNFQELLAEIKAADSFAAVYTAVLEIDSLTEHYKTAANLCEIRNTMDTNDSKYKQETEFWAEISPLFEELQNQFYEQLLQSKYQPELEKYLGAEFFRRIKMMKSEFSEEILALMQEENQYSMDYTNLTANLSVMIDGQPRPLSYLAKQAADGDRQVRSDCNRRLEECWSAIGHELDQIFDRLVQVRHQIAQKSGYQSYTDLSYQRRGRTSYGKSQVATLRQAIKQQIVPILQQLYEKQSQEQKLDILYHYDEDFSGVKLTPREDIVEAFIPVYRELSPETDIYYQDLMEAGFYDVDLRPGKIMGAYCNMLGRYRLPFIFETYNATFGAVKTFAHETGHGFHAYLNRGEPIQFLQECSADLAEIHSMAMEFLIWPYLQYIIPPAQMDNYKLQHLKTALAFIPYGCAVDEFQETIYDQPDLSAQERLSLWQRLEREYLPWRHYENDIFFARGRFWQKQTHIYKWPFYYIDYVLAQICAFQVHYQAQEDPAAGWQNYRKILKESAYHSFLDTITRAGLQSPFADETITQLAGRIAAEISVLKEDKK